VTTLRLVLGDQLDPGHPWFARVRDHVVYALLEVRHETDYVLHHAQKILAILAEMRNFARQLEAAGHRVHYLAIDDPANLQDIPANLDVLLAETQPARSNARRPTNGGSMRNSPITRATLPSPCARSTVRISTRRATRRPRCLKAKSNG
jgi:deoxyribodipyrimidine photolyase-related protein